MGDPVEVHALVTPGSEQMHVFSLGGESWPLDPFLPGSNEVQARGIGPWETLQADIRAGAGGGTTVGDIFYGDLRRPFTDGGLWGIQRVLSDATCPIRPLDARGCTGGSGNFITLDAVPPVTLITQAIPAISSSTTVAGAGQKVRRPASRVTLLRARGGQAIAVRPAVIACKPSPGSPGADVRAGRGRRSRYGHCRRPRLGRRPRPSRDDDRRGPAPRRGAPDGG